MGVQNWETPYKVKIGRGWLGMKRFHVTFDEDTRLTTTFDFEEATRLAAMLNGAYNLGKSRAAVQLSYENVANKINQRR